MSSFSHLLRPRGFATLVPTRKFKLTQAFDSSATHVMAFGYGVPSRRYINNAVSSARPYSHSASTMVGQITLYTAKVRSLSLAR